MTEYKQAAKAVLWCGNEVLTVTTPSGVLNLPGGGILPGEAARRALLRELDEEIPGFLLYDLSRDQIGEVTGAISRGRTAVWHVFEGQVLIPRGLRQGVSGQIPSENQYFNLLPPLDVISREALASHGRLASKAIQLCERFKNPEDLY